MLSLSILELSPLSLVCMYICSSERKIEREVVMASSVSNATQINGYFTDVYYEPESGSGSGSGSGSSVTYETRHMCFGSTAISDTHTYYICLVSHNIPTTYQIVTV